MKEINRYWITPKVDFGRANLDIELDPQSGDWVKYEDAKAEIDRLKEERKGILELLLEWDKVNSQDSWLLWETNYRDKLKALEGE